MKASLAAFSRLGALLALLAVGSSGCRTGTTHEYNHWKAIHHDPIGAGVWNRAQYHFLSYRPDIDGSYGSFVRNQAGDIWTTFERHFLIDSDENPFLTEDESTEFDPPSHHDIPEWGEYD